MADGAPPLHALKTPLWAEVRRDGSPTASYRNAQIALREIGAEFWFDEFRQAGYVKYHMLGCEGVEFSDRPATVLREAIVGRFGFDPTDPHIWSAAKALFEERHVHRPLDYLNALTWDRIPRLDTWLIACLGAEDTTLNREIGRRVLIAAVRRLRQPGCKFDHVLVLEGRQRAGKSSALRILAKWDDAFTDQDMLHLPAKEQMEAIAGKWIVELAELSGMRRTDVERVKAFISRQFDRARPAYARGVVNQPRQCIMVGTTNDTEYLSDQTGNTRFWPVPVGAIDLDAMRDVVDQLWAEAAAAEAAGEPILIDRELWPEAEHEQKQRLESHPWDDVLREVTSTFEAGEERVFTSTVLSTDLGILKEKQTRAAALQARNSMRRNGWDGPSQIRIGEKNGRGYRRKYGGASDG